MDLDIFRVSMDNFVRVYNYYLFQLLFVHGLIICSTISETFFDRVEELDLFNKPLKIGFQTLENSKPKNQEQKITRQQLEELLNPLLKKEYTESKKKKENIIRKQLNDILSNPSKNPYSSASYVNNEFRFNKLIPRHNSRSFKNAIPDYPVDAPSNTFFGNLVTEDANSIRKTRNSPSSDTQNPGGYISPHTIHYGGFQPIDDKPQELEQEIPFSQRLFTTPMPNLIANNKHFDIRNEIFTSYDEFKALSQDVTWAPIFGNKVTPQPVIKTESTPTIFSQIIQETPVPTVTKTFPQTINGFFTT